MPVNAVFFSFLKKGTRINFSDIAFMLLRLLPTLRRTAAEGRRVRFCCCCCFERRRRRKRNELTPGTPSIQLQACLKLFLYTIYRKIVCFLPVTYIYTDRGNQPKMHMCREHVAAGPSFFIFCVVFHWRHSTLRFWQRKKKRYNRNIHPKTWRRAVGPVPDGPESSCTCAVLTGCRSSCCAVLLPIVRLLHLLDWRTCCCSSTAGAVCWTAWMILPCEDDSSSPLFDFYDVSSSFVPAAAAAPGPVSCFWFSRHCARPSIWRVLLNCRMMGSGRVGHRQITAANRRLWRCFPLAAFGSPFPEDVVRGDASGSTQEIVHPLQCCCYCFLRFCCRSYVLLLCCCWKKKKK